MKFLVEVPKTALEVAQDKRTELIRRGRWTLPAVFASFGVALPGAALAYAFTGSDVLVAALAGGGMVAFLPALILRSSFEENLSKADTQILELESSESARAVESASPAKELSA